jgi:hypothetical protein
VWLNRHGLAALPFARVGVASLFVSAALFSFAMSNALQANARRPRWLLLAAVLIALLIATGTRTAFVLLVAPLAIVIASRRDLATRSFRLALLAPIVLIVALAFGVAVVELTHADTTALQKRVSLLKSSGNSQFDASYNDRIKEGRAAWSAFESSPVFGVGPGYSFTWLPQGAQKPVSGFVLDTPLTFPAKFGIAGLLLFVFVLAKFWSFLRTMARLSPGISHLALSGYLAFVGGMCFFAPPFEDKGFSYGLILALALALSSFRDSSRRRVATATDPT